MELFDEGGPVAAAGVADEADGGGMAGEADAVAAGEADRGLAVEDEGRACADEDGVAFFGGEL